MSAPNIRRAIQLLPTSATTGIGSLPHTQLEMGLQAALALDIPFLPQLPVGRPSEFMIPQALDGLLSMRERSRYLRGMTVWVGFTQAAVPYQRDARYAGETKYTLRRMLAFSLDAISSFSHLPLQAATVLGFLFSFIAFLAIPVVIGLKLADSYLPGFSTITIVILLLGGMNLIAVGIIGEYVGRIYDEVKRRPLYLVRERRNLREDDAVDDAERERISTW